MASKSGKNAKNSKDSAFETSESIAEQTRRFLEGGGVVQEINRGTSGIELVKGRRHITIAKK